MPRKLNIRRLLAGDIAGNEHLLPDEDKAAFGRFEESMLLELSPSTTYETVLAQNIVRLEYDILRHRRILAATIQSAFDEQAGGVFDDGKPGRSSRFYYPSDDRDEFVRFLRSKNESERATAEKFLEKQGVTRSEITAGAFSDRESAVSYHESRLSDLERRRRSLLNDYDAFKARNKSKKQDTSQTEVTPDELKEAS